MKNTEIYFIAFFSCLALSPIGWSYLLVVNGAFVPEAVYVLVFCYVYIFHRNILSFVLKDRNSLTWIVLCFFLLVLGLFFTEDFAGAYSDFRVVILVGICFFLIRDWNGDECNLYRYLMWLSLFSLAFHFVGYFLLERTGPKFNIATPMMILLVYTSLMMKTNLRFFLVSLLIFISIVSGFRSNIAISMMLLFLVVLGSIFSSNSGIRITLKVCFFSCIAVVFSTYFYNVLDVIYYLIPEDSVIYHQVIYKSELLIESMIDGGEILDEERSLYFPFIFEYFPYFLFPGGFGHDYLILNWRSFWMPPSVSIPGNSIDTGFGFLAAHFGILISLYIFWSLIRSLLSSFKFYDIYNLLVYVTVVSCLVFYFSVFGGHAFTQLAHGVGFGIVLGLLARCPRINIYKTVY